jgi:hypothetical protein
MAWSHVARLKYLQTGAVLSAENSIVLRPAAKTGRPTAARNRATALPDTTTAMNVARSVDRQGELS